MSETAPKVTALVSTYNAERFMRGCLEDLARQTLFSRTEVIVVDSASPQNERAIVEEFQAIHPNIRYVRTERREGLYAAWNRGIRMARGEYLTNANTDDRHASDAFEIMARKLDGDPGLGLVYGATAITPTENSVLGDAPVTGRFKARPYDRRRLFRDCLPGPQPMWRRSLHDRFGYFDESMISAGDYEFWLRISAGTRFAHIPRVLGLFLDSAASVSHSNAEQAARETEAARDKHWPAEWGSRADAGLPLLDRLTRRSTYRRWFAGFTGRGSSAG